jgi:tripartite-type tricarboxylate transporter receptor subunit TctC
MKRILLAFLLTIFSSLSMANKEVVTIIFAFGAGDSVANYGRTLVEEANRIQNKYTFVFDNRPGAGGTIAAKHVERTPNTILMTSAAFFIRPNVAPTESHSIDQFSSLMIQCTAPMAVGSLKYKSWNDIPKDKELTFGITGIGAMSHITALQIKEKYPNLILVPFKSPSEGNLALVTGQIDATVGFLSEFAQWTGKNGVAQIYVLGLTGARSAQGAPTLYSAGFKEVDQMGNPQQLFVPKSVPLAQRKEWHKILTQANKAPTVLVAYQGDSCQPGSFSYEEMQESFVKQNQLWRKLTANLQEKK